MAMIQPTEGRKFERDPEEANIPTGIYLAELSRVQETGPSAKFPGGNNRLVFEFTICDPNHPNLAGKKAVIFLGKTLLKTKEGKESALVKFARMMGVVNPEQGFDPDVLIHKRFNVMIEYTEGANGQSGRGWVRQAMVANTPSPNAPQFPNSPTARGGATHDAATGTQAPPPDDAPPPDEAPALDPAARWDFHNGKSWELDKSTADVEAHITFNAIDPVKLWVKKAGEPREKAVRADSVGFRQTEVIPY